MNPSTIHNPDRFMVDLRQILSQGRKRVGLLMGAGAPVAVKVNAEGRLGALSLKFETNTRTRVV